MAKAKSTRTTASRTRPEHLPTRMRFGVNVERVLSKRGLKREKLALLLNSSSLASACLDGSRGVTIDTIGRVAALLDCDISDLFAELDEDGEKKAAEKLADLSPPEVGRKTR